MRAMRKHKPDAVPRELLEQLVEAASWAPSGSNAQAYSWVIVTDRVVLQRLQPIWGRCHELYWATLASTLGTTMDATQLAGLRRAVTYQRDHFTEIPALLVACYEPIALRGRLLGQWRGLLEAFSALSAREALAATLNTRRATAMAEAASAVVSD